MVVDGVADEDDWLQAWSVIARATEDTEQALPSFLRVDEDGLAEVELLGIARGIVNSYSRNVVNGKINVNKLTQSRETC